MSARICTIAECNRPAAAKELCHLHYNRYRRHGDPRQAHRMVSRSASLVERLRTYAPAGIPTACWFWEGTLHHTGYGWMQFEGRQLGAHVWAYIQANGPVPPGMQILHSCDNRACVNPAHLRAGTHDENMDDKVQRNRTARNRGEAGPNKISEAQAREIISLRAAHGTPYRELSARFGISKAQVANICAGRRWPHLNSPIEDIQEES